MTHDSFKLGKKLGVVNDPRTFRFASLMPLSMPLPPRRTELSAGQKWPLFANDRYGDCTFASSGHRVIAQERNARQHEAQLTDQDILEGYSAVTGFRPDDPSTDNGAYMLDVANYLRGTGIGREKDGSRHTVTAFVKVDHNKPEQVRVATWMFGGLWIGVWLPLSVQGTGYWTVPDEGPHGRGEPGSWGGHAIYVTGYDDTALSFVSWGRRMTMSWAFFATYVDEAYALLAEDYLRSNQTTARGFNVTQLQGYLAELG